MEDAQDIWENIRRHKTSGSHPPDWPEGVKAISAEGLSLLGIDEAGRLYWDGKQLPTLTLNKKERQFALLGICAAVLAALGACASAAADWYIALDERSQAATPAAGRSASLIAGHNARI